MWWFKQAVLRPTFADVQAMHPWFLDYEQLEPGVRELVWTLNQTDLVETSPPVKVTRSSRTGGRPLVERLTSCAW